MTDFNGGLKGLAALKRAELEMLHQQGRLPRLEDMDGRAEGAVFNLPTLSLFRLWRGKQFRRAPDGSVEGLNRIGMGRLEVRRYRFVARLATSAFSAREIVLLDHDLPGNPVRFRRFHDELVQIAPRLYLASSHIRRNEQLHYVCHFALDFGKSGVVA